MLAEHHPGLQFVRVDRRYRQVLRMPGQVALGIESYATVLTEYFRRVAVAAAEAFDEVTAPLDELLLRIGGGGFGLRLRFGRIAATNSNARSNMQDDSRVFMIVCLDRWMERTGKFTPAAAPAIEKIRHSAR
jgi:hypothetical protein